MGFHTRRIFELASGAAVAAALLFAAPALGAGDRDIEDRDIALAIDAELFQARGVDAHEIDVSAVDGIVTLEGTADSLLARDRALRIAESTKGVRSVVDRLTVTAPPRSDREIRSDVISALAADPATDSWEIQVGVDEGVVSLDGSVDSYAEQQLASQVARSVRGVRDVKNGIAIRYRTDRSDAEIESDIEQRLAFDVRVDEALIEVEVEDGAVTLTGTAGSAVERERARGDAYVSGAKSVDVSGLEIEWWARDRLQRKEDWPDVTDAEIERAVKDALLYDPRVFSFEPRVSVRDGVVTLEGVVDNAKARRAAAQDAWNTLGVWRVKNHIKVRTEQARTAAAIEQDVREALKRDPYVTRHAIDVDAIGGTVRLAGTVDSYFEREQAEDIASRVTGVSSLNNQLAVDYASPGLGYLRYYDWDPALYAFDFDHPTTVVKSDAEIESEIESELWWSPFVDANQVEVEVDDGVATLEGSVDSWTERNAASDNAIEGGAHKVVNHLAVTYGPES